MPIPMGDRPGEHMLAFTKKTGYGLIAMTHLARLPDGELASAREVAETFGVELELEVQVWGHQWARSAEPVG